MEEKNLFEDADIPKIIKVLLTLYAEQEGVEIEYTIEKTV